MEQSSQIKKVSSNQEIRTLAKQQLKGKWGIAVLAALIYAVIITIVGNVPIPGTSIGPYGDFLMGQKFNIPVLSFLFSGAITLGVCIFYLGVAKNKNPDLANLFGGFNQFLQSIIAYFIKLVSIILGTLLFVIPGIIAALGLSQMYYIMADKPGTSAIDAMKESWEMTKGYKGQIFLMFLSFIPWAILCVFTLFIGFLWLLPYAYVSFSNFYLQLKGHEAEYSIEDHLVV